MKIILKLSLLACLLIIGFWISCSEDIKNDLVVETEELTLTDAKNINRLISIKNGNGNYSVWSDNEKVAKALYRREYGENITILPESTGKSIVTIRDDNTGQFKKIVIHVVPALE